jgi:hypothetical protein
LGAISLTTRDSWFMAASAAVAETPDRIYSLFENISYPENGAF